jgi:orotate phosphoribosyltransferase
MNKNELINLLIENKAIKFGRFILTSGAISDYYIDIKKVSTNPKTLKKIAEYMTKYSKGYDIIAGMELGAVPIVVALSIKTDKPFVIIRKDKKEHGTAKEFEGDPLKGKKVLIIEDVTTSGGSVVRTIQIIRENKGLVDQVVAVVDRESGAKEKLIKLNVRFKPLITVNDLLNK